jgi:hypothetical protein
MNNSVPGVIFAVSNDGGKTAVAWRENIDDAFAYLDIQNRNGVNCYSVVAVRKANPKTDEFRDKTS